MQLRTAQEVIACIARYHRGLESLTKQGSNALVGGSLGPLSFSKGFHTSLLILVRRHRITARIRVYNEQICIQTRWMSDQHDDKKGKKETSTEEHSHAR